MLDETFYCTLARVLGSRLLNDWGYKAVVHRLRIADTKADYLKEHSFIQSSRPVINSAVVLLATPRTFQLRLLLARTQGLITAGLAIRHSKDKVLGSSDQCNEAV